MSKPPFGNPGFGRYGKTPEARARERIVGGSKTQGESQLSAKIKKSLALQNPGSKWWKNAGSEFGEAGLPDLMGILSGRLVAIEVKINKGWFSPLQVAWLRAAEKAGAIAIGMLFDGEKWWIIPTTAMGHKGNRKRNMWVEIDFPQDLSLIRYWETPND